MDVMSRLRHANIVSLLGVCTDDDELDPPPCAVLEYARAGDLASFLRGRAATAPHGAADRATDDEINAASTNKLR